MAQHAQAMHACSQKMERLPLLHMDMQQPLAPLEFDVGISPADWMAWSLQFDGQAANRKRRLRTTLITIAILPVIALIGLIAVWLADPHRVPLSESWRFAPRIIWEEMGVLILIVWAIALASLMLRKRLVRSQLNRMMKGEPAVAEMAHVRIGPEGIDYHEPHIPTRIGWPGIKRWEQTDTHFFVIVSAIRAFVIPKRDLAPAIVQAITNWLETHVPKPDPR
jgi:YcxB-like protein